MRQLWCILAGILLVFAVGGIGLAQTPEVEIEKEIMPYDPSCGDMMGQRMIRKYVIAPEMSDLEMMGLGTMGDLMQDDLCCSAMMHSPKAIDHYLCLKDEIGLLEEQVKSLKTIKDSHQRDIIRKSADLQLAMLDLDNLLSEKEVDLSKAESLTKQIGSIQAEMKFKEIEALVKAKRILTAEQREKLENLGEGLLEGKRCRRIIVE